MAKESGGLKIGEVVGFDGRSAMVSVVSEASIGELVSIEGKAYGVVLRVFEETIDKSRNLKATGLEGDTKQAILSRNPHLAYLCTKLAEVFVLQMQTVELFNVVKTLTQKECDEVLKSSRNIISITKHIEDEEILANIIKSSPPNLQTDLALNMVRYMNKDWVKISRLLLVMEGA